MRNAYLQRLASIDLLRGLRKRDLESVGRLGTTIDVDRGRCLCRDGRVGGALVIVLAGELTVWHACRIICHLAPGDWYSKHDVAARSRWPGATVIAHAPSEVLVFSDLEFRDLVRVVPRLDI